jgi:low temperature requirement protein LtrA
MVWFAWVNGSYYHELHGNEDIRTRVFVFLQMLALTGMAIFAPSAMDTGADGFAVSYAVFLAIVGFLWWRTGVYDPEHRPLSDPLALSFLVAIVIFFASVFFDAPTKFFLWGGAITFLTILPPIIQGTQKTMDPTHLALVERMRPSIIERFGLLTIIVLGEVLNSIVAGASHHEEIVFPLLLAAVSGFVIVATMWWLYFDVAAHRAPKPGSTMRWVWIYLHLPITMSIALVGAGLLNIFEHEHFGNIDRWLIVGPVALFLIILIFLGRAIKISEESQGVYRMAGYTSLVSVLCIFAVGFSSLTVLPTLGLVSLFLLLPVIAGFKLWVRDIHPQQKREV